VKIEAAPFIGMLRQPGRNTFFHVIRDWQVRATHFPKTIHVRRVETCSACGVTGHRKTNRSCAKYASYLAERRAARIRGAQEARAGAEAALADDAEDA